MGAVYVAEQLSTGKERALKVMHPELVTREKLRQRFVQEARIGAQIESDHVVEVLGADAAAHRPVSRDVDRVLLRRSRWRRRPRRRKCKCRSQMVAAKNPKVEFWSGKILYPAIVVLLVLSGFFALAILPRLLERSHPMVGKPAPEVNLPVIPGTPSDPATSTRTALALSSLRGKVVVLDFWAPWCSPCREEMPELDRLSRKLSAEGVTFVGVMVDGDPIQARDFVQQAGIGYAQLDDDGKAARDYGVRSLPSIIVIDRQGTVRSYRSGYAPGEEVEDAIRRAM